jgi:hypothetical protein
MFKNNYISNVHLGKDRRLMHMIEMALIDTAIYLGLFTCVLTFFYYIAA